MKHSKLIAAWFGVALAFNHSSLLLAADNTALDTDIPPEIVDFAAQNGLELGEPSNRIANKFNLSGKTANLSGKLSIQGKVTYQGREFPFSAPGANDTWKTSYTFGQKQANGSIPFKLNRLGGNFGGVMTPTKPDTYNIKLNNKQGSLLSSLAQIGQKSGSGTSVWKNTSYSYTATVSSATVGGVSTKFLEAKEKATFNFNLKFPANASATYTYSYAWKGPLK
jgi:hypothetical protein